MGCELLQLLHYYTCAPATHLCMRMLLLLLLQQQL
jgi:hypothetical protein